MSMNAAIAPGGAGSGDGARSGDGSGAFNPKLMAGLILFGAAAFLATLYFIGSGQTGRDINDGGAHAAGNGLTGYAALVGYLEEEQHDVIVSRSKNRLDDYGLLVLTAPNGADAQDINAILDDRTFIGPTLVIVPKWVARQIPPGVGTETEDGWVALAGTQVPGWTGKLEGGRALSLAIDGQRTRRAPKPATAELPGSGAVWSGFDRNGHLPTAARQTETGKLTPVIRGLGGVTLAGYLQDNGIYPGLESAANTRIGTDIRGDGSRYPILFVVEPDLMNNYGFSQQNNAEVAHAMIDAVSDGRDMPIIFDLTLNGLGAQRNLLTLAFAPPFLAATLCLMLALIMIGWRAFVRFGPPIVEGRSIAFGKERLVANSANFIQRSKRLHLLTAPYAHMVQLRLAKALGLRQSDVGEVDAALARRWPDQPSFSQRANDLRAARSPHDILSAAAALRRLERMLTK